VESATMLTFAHEEAEALLGGSPFSRVSLRRRTELERWLRRTPEACPTQRLMVINDERSLRGSLGNILRSSLFCRPRLRVVPCHSQSYEGEKSPVGGDVDHCPPPYLIGAPMHVKIFYVALSQLF
jgi:hypothetical protein